MSTGSDEPDGLVEDFPRHCQLIVRCLPLYFLYFLHQHHTIYVADGPLWSVIIRETLVNHLCLHTNKKLIYDSPKLQSAHRSEKRDKLYTLRRRVLEVSG